MSVNSREFSARRARILAFFSLVLIFPQTGHAAVGSVSAAKIINSNTSDALKTESSKDVTAGPELLHAIQSNIQELKYKNSEQTERKIADANRTAKYIADYAVFLEGAVQRARLETTSLTYLNSIRNQLKLNRERCQTKKNKIISQTLPLRSLIGEIRQNILKARNIANSNPSAFSGDATYGESINEIADEAKITISESLIIIKKYDAVITKIINLEKKNLTYLKKINDNIHKKNDAMFINQGSIFNHQNVQHEIPYSLKERAIDSFMISKNYLGIYWKLILLFIIISAATTWVLRNRSNTERLVNSLEEITTNHLLNYPFSASLSIFVLLSLSILPLPPTLINLSIFLLATLPVIRFGIHHRAPHLKPYEFMVMIGFILLLLIVIAPLTIYSRILVISINIVMAYVFFMLFKAARSWGKINHYRKIFSYLFLSSFLLIIASTIINIYGYYLLSFWLTNHILFASYFGFIVYAICRSAQLLWEAFCYSNATSRVNTIYNHRSTISHKGKYLIGVISAIIWPLGVLSYWGVDIQLSSYIAHSLKMSLTIGSLTLTPGPIILFAFLIWAAFKVASASRVIFNEEVVPRSNMKKGAPLLVGTAIQMSVIIFGFIFAMVSSGINLSNVTLVVSALSVGIGLGLQSVVLNFVSGIILMIERPIRSGDSVELKSENLSGQILTIGLRTTMIRTYDGADVVVPNSKLTTEQVINWTLSSQERRVVIDFGVAYGSAPNQIIDLVLSILNNTKELLKDPPPAVVFVGLGDSSLDFQAKYWVAEFSLGVSSKSDLLGEIYSVLNENGIGIPFPQQDIYIKELPKPD